MCYLEGANPDKMEKSVYLSCESWIVAASNQPGINALAHLDKWALWQQLSAILWVFRKERAACHFLLGSHHPVHFYQIRLLTTGMAVNSPRTLPTEPWEHISLNSFSMEWCNVSKQGHFLMLPWDSESNGRSSTSSCDCRVFAALGLKEMHMGSFASSLGSQLKAQALAYCCYKVTWQCNSAHSRKQLVWQKHSQNTPPWSLVYVNDTVCSRSVFAELWSCGGTFLWT